MALMITDSCINCGYCMQECPNQAIYEPGMKWAMNEGTTLKGTVVLFNGLKVDAAELLPPMSSEHYFIAPDKCAECTGVYESPQCQEVCPDLESFAIHPNYQETKMHLLMKQSNVNAHLMLTEGKH